LYHVINRDNYRSWIFETEAARRKFLKYLEQACVALTTLKGAEVEKKGVLPPAAAQLPRT
jgi:hypothetical protein